MVDLHLFAFNCNESFRIVVDKKEKRAKLFCLTLSISFSDKSPFKIFKGYNFKGRFIRK